MGIQAEQKGVGEPCQRDSAALHLAAADRRMSVQTIHPPCEQARVGVVVHAGGEPCQRDSAALNLAAADRRMSVQTIHPLCEQARVGWLIRTDAWLYRKTFYITMVDSFGSVFYDETDRGGAGCGSKA